MIRAVLFDLDETMLDRNSSVRAFIHHQYGRLHDHVGHIPKTAYVERFLTLDNHGYGPKPGVYQTLIAEYAISTITADQLVDDFRNQFDKHCVGFAHLHEMLTELRNRGLRLGVITNGFGPVQQSKIAVLGIEAYFDAVLISDVEGIKKPDPAIFDRALARLRVSAEETVFVGDHPVLDVQGAKSVGMAAIWKRTYHHDVPAEADAIIDDLWDVVACLDRLKG